MAEEFTSYLEKNVGLTPIVVIPAVAASTTTTLIGASACNVAATPIKVTAYITRSGIQYHLVKDVDVPVGSSLIICGGDQKIGLITGDTLSVVSDTINSLDVVVSTLNITAGA